MENTNLPVGNRRRDFPIDLFFSAYGPRRTMHDWNRRRAWTARDLQGGWRKIVLKKLPIRENESVFVIFRQAVKPERSQSSRREAGQLPFCGET